MNSIHYQIVKKLLFITALIQQAATQVFKIDETNRDLRFGTGSSGSPSYLKWHNSLTSLTLCNDPAEYFTKTVIAFWFKFTGPLDIGMGVSSNSGSAELPASTYFKFADLGACMEYDPSGSWVYAYYEIGNLCNVGPPSTDIIFYRRVFGMDAAPCSGSPETPLQKLGFDSISTANPKTLNFAAGFEVKRLITMKKTSPAIFGIEALIYAFGHPVALQHIKWSVSPSLLEFGVVAEAGNKGNIYKRMDPWGFQLKSDSNEFVFVDFSQHGNNLNQMDKAKTWAFFNTFWIELNQQHKLNLANQKLIIKVTINFKTSGGISDIISDFDHQYTLKLELLFAANLDMSWTLVMGANEAAGSPNTYTVTFPVGYTNSFTFAEAGGFHSIPLALQIALVNKDSAILKAGIPIGGMMQEFGEAIHVPMISTGFDANAINMGMFVSYSFDSPTPDLETVSKGISVLLDKTNVVNGGYFVKTGQVANADCMIYQGVGEFSTCVECHQGFYLTNENNVGNGNYPTCAPCISIGPDFGECDSCSEDLKCSRAFNDRKYFYTPAAAPNEMWMRKLKRDGTEVTDTDLMTENPDYVDNCNGDLSYNYFNTYTGIPGCFPCEVSTCYCSAIQTETTNAENGKKTCGCQFTGCDYCPVLEVGNVFANVGCSSCDLSEGYRFLVKNFQTMDIECKKLEELEEGWGIKNSSIYEKCKDEKCKENINLTGKKALIANKIHRHVSNAKLDLK